MNKLRNKLKNRKGFTLVEMLIVVAIIAILVVVSIPLVSSSLNKAKVAADQANIRAAKAAANVKYLDGTYNTEEDDATGAVAGTYFYDAEDGTLEPVNSGIKAYGQSTEKGLLGITDTAAPKGNILKVEIKDDGSLTLSWVEPGAGE